MGKKPLLTVKLLAPLDLFVEQIGCELVDNALVDRIVFEAVLCVVYALVARGTATIGHVLVIQIEDDARLADLRSTKRIPITDPREKITEFVFLHVCRHSDIVVASIMYP